MQSIEIQQNQNNYNEGQAFQQQIYQNNSNRGQGQGQIGGSPGDYRQSINKSSSDPSADNIINNNNANMESMRGKKKSKFNDQQQVQQQILLQQNIQGLPLITENFGIRTNKYKYTPIFKNFAFFKNSSNIFEYINPNDKYRTWRDTHIDALECFNFFCQSLLANQTLQELKIGGIQYCDILIEELCATLQLMPSLKYLDLSNLQLDCQSWRSLSKYVGSSRILERINLQNNSITDECIRDFFNCFRNNNTVQDLNLANCRIEQGHVNILLRLLANNKSIKRVNLSNGTLNDENAEGIAEFLSNCCKIQLLDISNNNLGRSFFDRLNQNLSQSTHKKPKIQCFDIGSNFLNTKEDSTKHSGKFIDSLISILKKLKGVYKLNVSNNFLETDDIKRLNIEANKNKRQLIVEELDLSFNKIERNFPENFFQNLKSLNLKNNILSLSSVEVIARTLKDEQTKWEILDISENRINNSGLEILINYLKENNKLKELYCSSNEIEGVGMISIIINNERMNLNKIDLSENKFTLNSIISYLNSLKNQSLNKICLRNFDEAIKASSKSLLINESKIIFDQPFSLDLQKSAILAQHVFKGFDRHLPKLNSLNIAYCTTFNEDDMKRLAYLISNSHTLTYLNLEGINLGGFSDQCLENLGLAFSENRCLKELNMRKCRLGGKFYMVARDIGNINSLVELDISENDLTDSIVNVLQAIIQKCFHLNHLNLSNNNVGNGCIHAIIRGLKGNSSLQKLTMSKTDVTAGELLSFSQLLQNCGHLKHLDISENKLLDVNLSMMNSLELKPDKIVLQKKKLIDSQMIQHLKLIMEDNFATKELVLDELDIPKFYISRILEQITLMENLQKMSIKNLVNPIDPEKLNQFLKRLLNMPMLQKIQFVKLQLNNNQLGLIGQLLQSSPKLNSLYLSEENLSNQNMVSLCNGLQNNQSLKKLKLIDCNISSNDCIILGQSLSSHKQLELINLNLNSITEQGVISIMGNLKNIQTLKKIHFSEQRTNDVQSIQCLLNQVSINFLNLTHLILSHNQFQFDQLSNVLESLKNHPNLYHIDFSGNLVNENGANEIKKYISHNSVLKQLVLRSCGLEVKGFKEISQGVYENDTLELLDLSSNTYDGDSAIQFFGTLVYPKSLKLFIVSNNQIGQQGNIHLQRFMSRCTQKLFIVNDWMNMQDDLGIELLSALIHIYNKQDLLPGVPRHYYTCIDFSRGHLTDKFCLYFTENFQKLHMLECLNLEKNYYITQIGMKHVFTAVYDNRRNFDLNLIFLSFAQREDDFLAVQKNAANSNNNNSAINDKNNRKLTNNYNANTNQNIKNNQEQQNIQKRRERSIWQKITLYFQRKSQFIKDKITSNHEYKFDYCNLEKINLLKYQNLMITLLGLSFFVTIILSVLPFVSQGILIRSIILATSLLILIGEILCYCTYLYYVNLTDDIQKENLTMFMVFKMIYKKFKYFDLVLLIRGLARRADFILTIYIAIFYFVDEINYLPEVYNLFLVMKGMVLLFFTISPFYDWCFKKRNQGFYSKDKQFLDVGERLSMVFGMSLVEQIFQLFNPGTSSVLSFQMKKQSQRQVINIWNKKVYEYIYLTFYITPLLVLYAVFYDKFTLTYQKQIIQLAFAVLAIGFALSVFTIFTTRPTYIQQADFNEILNIRKFNQIEKARSKNRCQTVRKTLFENMKQRQYSTESYFFQAQNYVRNTQLKRLIRADIITADIDFIQNSNNNKNKNIDENQLLIQSNNDNSRPVRIFVQDIQDSLASIPHEVGDSDQNNRDIHNQFVQLKKIKNE